MNHSGYASSLLAQLVVRLSRHQCDDSHEFEGKFPSESSQVKQDLMDPQASRQRRSRPLVCTMQIDKQQLGRFWLVIPEELIVRVMLFLIDSPKCVGRIAMVSKQIYRLTQYEVLWKTLFFQRFPVKITKRPVLFVDWKEKAFEHRRRLRRFCAGWKDLVREIMDGEPGLLNFHGFYTDGGTDSSIPGTEMKRQYWAGNAFRADSRSFYCSEAMANVVLVGILAGNLPEQDDDECIFEKRRMLRLHAVLRCLKGSYYDISTSPQVLNRASTSELESRFIDIVENPTGLELLVSAKFGWYGLPFFFNSSRDSRDCYRRGLISLASKIVMEREAMMERDMRAVSMAQIRGCPLAFDGCHIVDEPDVALEMICPEVARAEYKPDLFALVSKVSCERIGNFSCPVNCAVIFASCDLLDPFADKFQSKQSVPEDRELALEIAKHLKAVKKRSSVSLFDGLTEFRQIDHLVSHQRLPPIAQHYQIGDAEIVEFTPSEPIMTGVHPVAWFNIAKDSRLSAVSIDLSIPRLTKYLFVKLISSDDRMSGSPNIDVSGLYAYGHVVQIK